MAGSTSLVKVVITGDPAQYNAAMKSAADTTDAAAAKIDGSTSSLSSKVGGYISKLGEFAAVGLAGVVVGAVHLADEMGKADNAIAANADISQAAAKKIGDAFLTTGGQSIFTGLQMAQAYATVAGQLGQLNGKALDTAQALKVETSAATLAEAGHVSLGSATSALTAVMVAFHQPISAVTEDMNILYKGGVLTGMGVEGLSATIAKFAAGLGAVKPPLAQTVGLIDDLTAHGETGRKAVSAVTTALTGLFVPTTKAAEAQFQYGIATQNAAGQALPLTTILGELQKATDGMGNIQAIATLKTLGLGTASLKLLDTIRSGPDALKSYTAAVDQHGAAATAAQKATANLDDEFKKAKAAVEDLVTQFGEKLLPVITDVVGEVSKVVDWFEKNRVAAEVLAGVIGTVLVVAMGVWVAGLGSNAAAMLASLAPASRFGTAMTDVALTLSRAGGAGTAMAVEIKAATTESGVAVDGLATQIGALRAEAEAPIVMGPVVPSEIAPAATIGEAGAGAGEAGAGAALGSSFATVAAPLLFAGFATLWALHQNKNAGTTPLTAPGQGGTAGLTPAEAANLRTDNIGASGRAARPAGFANAAETATATAAQQIAQEVAKGNALIAQIHGDGVKDATVKGQGATFTGMLSQLAGLKVGSAQYNAVLKGIQTTADKWYPDFAKDKTTAQMNTTIGKQFMQAMKDSQTLTGLSKDETLQATQAKLGGYQMQLLNEQKSGATPATLKATQGLINQQLGHEAAIHAAMSKLATITTEMSNEKALETALSSKLDAVKEATNAPRTSILNGGLKISYG